MMVKIVFLRVYLDPFLKANTAPKTKVAVKKVYRMIFLSFLLTYLEPLINLNIPCMVLLEKLACFSFSSFIVLYSSSLEYLFIISSLFSLFFISLNFISSFRMLISNLLVFTIFFYYYFIFLLSVVYKVLLPFSGGIYYVTILFYYY